MIGLNNQLPFEAASRKPSGVAHFMSLRRLNVMGGQM